jgi:hypothetical protein
VESQFSGLVWLSSEAARNLFNGPRADAGELRTLARMQIRKQLAERQGEMVFLVDPSVPTPAEPTWIVPNKRALYEQAATYVTGFACIRPGSLQTEVAAIDGIAARVPLIHWLHSGVDGMKWNVLPIDGGPAIQCSTPAGNKAVSETHGSKISWLKAPPAPIEVPLWMDDYISNNAALNCGETRKQGTMTRRFGWTDHGVTRDPFQVLRVGDGPVPEGKLSATNLPHGAVRSPRNLFFITVAQLGERGWYPEESDDGINVYLNDLRRDKSILLYFAGLYSAWPSAATWFTDRYVITSGVAPGYSDPVVSAQSTNHPDDGSSVYLTPQIRAQTIHLFDLQTGRSFVTTSIAPERGDRPNAPTERIFFPEDSSYRSGIRWQTLWKAIEEGYHAKPRQAPFTVEEVAELAKLPKDSGMQWKDLGIWPPPKTWQLVSETRQENGDYLAAKPVWGGDPFLTYIDTGGGQSHYRIAIASADGRESFSEQADIAAHADLFTIGGGSLPQLETIQRLGDNNRYLVLAGTYQKPGADESRKGKWMFLTDLLQHHSWSVHW